MPNCYCCAHHVNDFQYQTPNGEAACQTCFNRNYFLCPDCGRVAYRDDVANNESCYDCYIRDRFWGPTNVIPAKTFKRTKTPRCFGLELETSDCEAYRNLRGKTCFGVKEDGSIDGLEFFSPILAGDQGLAEVRKFCRLAKKHHFRVNEDCGYHLHIDMRGTTVTERKRIAYAYRLTFNLWPHFMIPKKTCFILVIPKEAPMVVLIIICINWN